MEKKIIISKMFLLSESTMIVDPVVDEDPSF